MKYISIFPSILTVLITATISFSCTDDNSSYGGGDLPTLSVSVPGDSENDMPVVSFNYGDECVITPQIIYSGSGKLSYEWSIGTYDNNVKGPLEFVTNDATLRHFFTEGGSYYAHLVVTDGTVGAVQEYAVNINRTFEQGYLVISNNETGIGNLTFIKDLTREEIEAGQPPIIMEHCLERVNNEIKQEPLAGAQIINWYVSATQSVTRVVICGETKGYYLDPNTFVASSIIDYDKIIPGFKAKQFIGYYTTPSAYDPVMKRYVRLNSTHMFGYEDSSWKEQIYDLVVSTTYYVGDNQSTMNYFVNRNPLSVHVEGIEGWTNTRDIQENGVPLFQNEELIDIFMGEGVTGDWGMMEYPCNVISRDKTSGKLYTTILGGTGAYSMGITLNGRGEMKVSNNSALPETESMVVASDTYHRTYFYNGNNLYAMLKEGNAFILPEENQYCISYPSDEKITFLTINSSTNELIVATCKNSTGRGSIYIYDSMDVRTDNPNPKAKKIYEDCTDRISYLTYKPRIAN